jgi:MOSC domain-containing protein YiiM
MPTLKSIVYKPKTAPTGHQTGAYLRVPLSEAKLVEGYGIEGDRKGGNPKRNLNIMDSMTLAELGREGYPTTPGALGENLIVDGIDLRNLPEGSSLQIGAEAVITLLKFREPCEQLTEIDERMPASVMNRVGYMARVTKGGLIRVGDPVVVIEPVKEA